jgi:hypothetical protein
MTHTFQGRNRGETFGLLQPIRLNSHPNLICAIFGTFQPLGHHLNELGDNRLYDIGVKAQHQHRKYAQTAPPELL